MKYAYLLLGLLIIGGYAFADYRGYEFSSTEHGKISPKGLRGSRSGSRSFWYVGFHGGK
jgi:hypothetical protein